MVVTLERSEVTASVCAFLQKPLRLLINGRWVDAASGKTFDTINPATGEVLAQVAEGDREDINRAVVAARAAFEGPWSKVKPYERQAFIYKLADLIDKNFDELSILDTLDMGAPISRSRAHKHRTLGRISYYGGMAVSLRGETIQNSLPGEYVSHTLKDPVGVVGAIIPWNGPLGAAVWKIGPVLATGCTMVLKPAEEAPLSCIRLGDEAGIPEGVVNIVTGYGETAGAALAEHPDVDKVAFTGSHITGQSIVRASAHNLKRVSLELGGKSPNIVFDDADPATLIPGVSDAIFFNTGQRCTAGSRLYVQKNQFDRVAQGVADIAEKIKIGNGFAADTQMGPVISQEQLDRVTGYLQSGFEQGAKALSGGARAGDNGYFVQPTVLVDANPSMKVVREEIFGPVVVVQPFDDLDDLIRQANDTTYGLAAGIWTTDVRKAHSVAAKLRAGTVWVNCYNDGDPALPFGGFKESGWGREMGHNALELYTEVKSVVIRL